MMSGTCILGPSLIFFTSASGTLVSCYFFFVTSTLFIGFLIPFLVIIPDARAIQVQCNALRDLIILRRPKHVIHHVIRISFLLLSPPSSKSRKHIKAANKRVKLLRSTVRGARKLGVVIVNRVITRKERTRDMCIDSDGVKVF